jgi:hypothetical protein
MVQTCESPTPTSDRSEALADLSWQSDRQHIYPESPQNSSTIRARIAREIMLAMAAAEARCINPLMMAQREYPVLPVAIVAVLYGEYLLAI